MNGLVVAAFVFGLVSPLTFGLIAIPGLVMAIIGRRQIHRSADAMRGVALGNWALGINIVGVLLAAWLVYVFVLLSLCSGPECYL